MAATASARAAAWLVAALTVAGLTACTGDAGDPGPSGSSASSDSSATGPGSTAPGPTLTPVDRSALVLRARLPAVAGTSTGSLDGDPATLEVAEVRATARGTRLTFWYTGADTVLLRRGDRGWTTWPTLVDVEGEKVYEPLTYVDHEGDTRCLCTDAGYIRGVPQPRTVLYPPLPERLDGVEVRHEGFARPVAVPVTRP